MKTLKLLFVIQIFVILTIGRILAQTDSLRFSQESGTLQKQRFIDQYDYVFMTKEPTKWIVKMTATDIAGSSFRDASGSGLLGGEYKLSPSFSVGANAGLRISLSRNNGFSVLADGYARWYYNMKKRIEEGKSANNFSGSYFGIGYSLENYYFRDLANIYSRTSKVGILAYSNQTLGISWGLQRRFFQHGWADFRLSLNKSNQENSNIYNPLYSQNESIELSTSWQVGLAIGDIKRNTARPQSCDVFRCLEEQKSWLKIRMPYLRIGVRNQWLMFGAAYERRLGNSAFSLSLENMSRFSGSNVYNDYTFKGGDTLGVSKFINKYSYNVANWSNLELRYYVFKKRQIAMGRTALNFSGVYVGLNQGLVLSYFIPGFSINGVETKGSWTQNYWTAPLIGIQQRLFKNGFIDFKFGIPLRPLTKNNNIGGLVTHNVTDLRIGFAF